MEKIITTEFFGIKLKTARKLRNMTQKDLASKLNVSDSTINYYEKSVNFPNLERFVKICTILDISPDYFLTTSEDFPFKSIDLDEEQMDTLMEFVSLIEYANALSKDAKKLKED